MQSFVFAFFVTQERNVVSLLLLYVIALLSKLVCIVVKVWIHVWMKFFDESCHTVPLKSKLTLESRTSRRDPRNVRGSRNKALSSMEELERISRKRFISRRKSNTVLLTPKVQAFRAYELFSGAQFLLLAFLCGVMA